MPGPLKTVVEISLEDKFSSGMKDAGKATQDFKEDAVDAARTADDAFADGMKEAGQSTQAFKEKAVQAAKNTGKAFLSGMKDAGNATLGFRQTAVNAAQAIDQAFSSAGAKIASLGVTIGTMALIKSSIDYEDSIIRIGTNAGMSGEEVNRFRRELLAIATDAKVPVKELVNFGQVVTDNSIGLETASEGMRFMADAMQGLGISGQEAGDIFSVLVQKGASLDTVKQKLNNLAEIDDRLHGMGLAEFAKQIPQLMDISEVTVDNIEDLYVSILTLNNGASNTQALRQYRAAMQSFDGSRDKIRQNLKGFDVRNQNGELKSFNEIMTALVEMGRELGSFERFNDMFGFDDNTIKAIKQFNNYAEETKRKIADLGDTSDAINKRAEQNAKSLASNIVSIQNNILKLSDAVLTKPLESIAKLLDENPKGMEMAIYGVAAAVAALGTMKALSTIILFISQIKGLKGGKIGAGLSGPGIPVHVTNAGAIGSAGTIGRAGLSGQNNPLAAAQNAWGNLKPRHYAMGAAGGGITAAFYEIPQMVNELSEINQNEDLTDIERGKAKGGAIGDAAGSIAGAAVGGAFGVAAGAAAGAAIGSVVPGLGTAIGLIVGAGVGALGMHLGGMGGRKLGETIGGSIADNGAKAEELYPRLNENSGHADIESPGDTGQMNGGGRVLSPRQQYARASSQAVEQYITRNGNPGQAGPETRGKIHPQQSAGRESQTTQTASRSKITAPAMQPQIFRDDRPSQREPETAKKTHQIVTAQIPPMQMARLVRIPESSLPPQITRNETTIVQPAEAKIEGSASIEVNVNLSGERPAAKVSVKNNNMPFFNFRSNGNAPHARLMSL